MIKKTTGIVSFFIFSFLLFLFVFTYTRPAFAQNCSGCRADQRCQSCGTYSCVVCVLAFPTSAPSPIPTSVVDSPTPVIPNITQPISCGGCRTDQRCQSCGTYACLVCVAAFPTSTPMPFPTVTPAPTDIPTSATTTCNQGAYCPLKTGDYCAPNGASTLGCTNVAVGSCVATPHNGYVQTYQGIYCFCKNNKWQCSSQYAPSCHFACTPTGSTRVQSTVSSNTTSSFLQQYIINPLASLF